MTKIHTLIRKVIFSLGILIYSAPAAFAERTCPSLDKFVADGSGGSFLLGPAYKIVADACSSIAVKTWDFFAEDLQAVMALGVAIYIAVYTLRNIGAFSQQDTSAYLSNEKTGIIPLLLKTAFIIALLSHRSFVYEYLVSPIVGTGMEVGKIVTVGTPFSDSSFTGSGNVRALFEKVIDQARDFNDRVYTIVAMGRLMMCLAFLPTVFLNWFWILIPFGMSLYIFGWMLIIFISFYLLDVLFRLGVGFMVLPFAIACGISKLTVTYTKKTWDIFVNTAFNFMTLGVVVSFTVSMIATSISGTGGEGSEGTDTMKKMLEGKDLTVSDAEALSDNISVMSFVLTALAFLIAMKLFSSVEDTADALSSTSSATKGSQGDKKGIGNQMLTESGKKASGAIKEPAKGLAKAAGQEIKDAASDTKIGHALGIGR